MTIGVLQDRQTSAGGSFVTSIALAYSSNLTAGSGLHAFGGHIDSANPTKTFSNSGTNVFSAGLLDAVDDTVGQLRIFHQTGQNAPAGASTVTLTFTGVSVSFPCIWIREIGSTNSTGNPDGHNAIFSSSTTSQTLSATNANQPALISSLTCNCNTQELPVLDASLTASSANPGWNFGGSTNSTIAGSKRITTTGSQSITDTQASADSLSTFMAIFVESGGVAAAPFKMPDTDERVTIKPTLLDFSPPNLLVDQVLKLPPFVQTDLLYKVQWKGVYTDFAPPNLLTQQTLKPPPVAPIDLSARIQIKAVAPDVIPTLILSPAVPSPYIPIDIGANVFRKPMAGDFIVTSLLTGHLPYPPVAPIDSTISIRAKGVFTDFSPPNLALSTLVAIAPTHATDAFLRLEYRWIRGDDIPPNTLLLAQAVVTPLLPQDISGLRLDARGLRSDFNPPNLTLFLPVPPPTPTVAAGRHGTRQQARRRRRLDVLRAKLEAFKEQRLEADRALMAMEDGELRARAKLLKRIRIKPLTKPLEEYAPIKKAIAQRTVVAERHRSILEQILLHQLEAERIQREIEAERDEEAAVQLMHFLMMELPWHE